MKKRKPLFTGYDWDVKLIEDLWPVIDKIGKEDLQLDYYQPQFDVVTADQMLDAYSSIGMPIFYNHWSFGKSYTINQQQYRKGKMNLAYEMVINSNPCLAYLMEDNCVDAQTEYLSENGWRKIIDFQGEKVLGYNSDGTATFVNPKKYIISDNTQPMIHIKGKGVDQLVTQNHRVIYYTQRGILKECLAKDILRSFLQKGHWQNIIPSTFKMITDRSLSLTDAELRLMVAVHAGGHFPTSGSYCRFDLKNKDKINRLIAILKLARLPFNISEKNKRGTTHISFHPPLRTKHYTKDFYSCSSEQLKIIAEECFYWDADLKTNSVYYSSCKEDVDFIQYACAASGFTSTVAKAPTCWRLTKSKLKGRNVSSAEEVKNERSYCFEMPSTMWVARRNGKVFITGNTAMMTALVMAHANVGHAAVFKMNYLFQQHTKPNEILNLLEYFKSYVRQMEEEHGEEEVEILLDCLHFIGAHGVDKFPRKEPPSAAEMKQRFLDKLETERKNYSKELDTLPVYKTSVKDLMAAIEAELTEFYRPVGTLHMNEENLLRVIEEHSLTMPSWQIKMVTLFRQVEQYFYPQMQTQVLNEGFACFCHYYIMTKLHDEGYINEGAYLEFLESHTAVCYQHPMAAINPYALGFAMFMDIKRACENPDEEDYKYLSTVAGKKDWRTELKNIVRYYKDESFIKQFLSPKVIRKFQLFALKDDTEEEYYEVTGIQSDDDVKIIRDTLSKQKELDNRKPNLEVVLIDRVENHMTINYTPYNNRGVEGLDTLREMMMNLTGMDVDIVLDEDYFNKE